MRGLAIPHLNTMQQPYPTNPKKTACLQDKSANRENQDQPAKHQQRHCGQHSLNHIHMATAATSVNKPTIRQCTTQLVWVGSCSTTNKISGTCDRTQWGSIGQLFCR